MNSGRFFSSLVLLVFLAGQVVIAQVTTGTILGTVSDSTGAVIPGATVTIRNVETGISRTVTADAAGRYRAPQLGLGSYEITTEAPGFQTAVRSGITLTVGREALVDFTLQVGSVAERITVTGEAPLVQTTTATVSSLVDEDTMRSLPLLGRSFSDLTALQPGVLSNLGIGGGDSNFASVYTGAGHTRRSIGGTKPQSSAYFLDGLEISTPSEGMPVNSILGEQLGVDAIREFTVLSGNYDARYGRAAGGVVNAVTQSGTNEVHGSAFEFFRNEALDARHYFLRSDLPKDPFKRNQFGASLGGPIKRDRIFFFVNYEGIRQSAADPRVGATLTPETREGKITGCPAGRSTCSKQESIVTQTVAVDPNIKVFFPLLPLPNGLYGGAGVGDLFSTLPWTADEDFGTVRVDQQFKEKDSMFVRFTKDRSGRTDNLEELTPEPFKAFQIGGYIIAAISETHLFSPTVLNTLRIGFTRRNDNLFYNYTRGGDQFPQAPGLDPRLSPVKGLPLGLWQIAGVSLKETGGVGPSLSGPANFIDNIFSYDDSVIINRGLHSLTVGGTFTRYRPNHDSQGWKYGLFSWQTIERFLTNKPFSTTQLVGTHVPGLQAADAYRGWRQTYGAIYVQDDFKVLPRLTLNLGLRWEKVTGPREVNGKVANMINMFQDKTVTLLGRDDPMFTLDDGLKGFSPRFGFAWDPYSNGRSVLRGGFGAFKEVPLTYVYQLTQEAPPYLKRYQVNEPILKFPFPFQDLQAVAGAAEPFITPRDVKQPYILQWTLSLEHQITETMVVKLNYVGTRGLNQWATYNPIQPLTQIVNGRHFVPPSAPNLNPSLTSIRYIAPNSNMYYHAGQVVLDKRVSGGLRFNSSYTLARNIDLGGGAGTEGADSVPGTTFVIYNQFDQLADKGLSALHVKHNFIGSYTYELPFGSGRYWGSQWSKPVNYILGGWVISGTVSLRSGLPVNVGMTPRQSRCVANQCPERPDLKPGGNNNPVLDNWTPEQYFDPSQFVLQPVGFFGNVGRHTLLRPGANSWNFSLEKDNPIGEGKTLEFRAEFFNFLNHPNFGAPNGTVFRNAAGALDPRVGRITSLSTSMRRVQLGLKFTF